MAIEHILGQVAQVLLMTVNPGFGGQLFIKAVIPKIEALRKIIEQRGLAVEIEVDVGINTQTKGKAARAGANVSVAGSAVFSTSEYGATLRTCHLSKNLILLTNL